jgi:hypothetical protein
VRKTDAAAAALRGLGAWLADAAFAEVLRGFGGLATHRELVGGGREAAVEALEVYNGIGLALIATLDGSVGARENFAHFGGKMSRNERYLSDI